MVENIVSDRSKGELHILGKRYVALDAEALCKHIDALLGRQIAEVIINNHEFRLGKEDAERFRREKPNASVEEIIERIKTISLLSGVGLTEVAIHDSGEWVSVEISNPCVKETAGAAKSLLFSYSSGVISYMFGKEYAVKDVQFNASTNVLSARIVPRGRVE